MSLDVTGFITWIRTFLDDVYAPKGSGGSDLDIDFIPKSENENGVICFSGGLTYDLDKVYPIGSIYMSVNSANPSTLFGGTWQKIQGRFLLASGTTSGEDPSVDNTYTLGDTGGSKDAVVVSHNHTQKAHSHQLPNSAIVYSSSYSGELPNGTAKKYGTNTQAKLSTNNTTAENNETGVSGANKNMPPYLVVNVWERTA